MTSLRINPELNGPQMYAQMAGLPRNLIDYLGTAEGFKTFLEESNPFQIQMAEDLAEMKAIERSDGHVSLIDQTRVTDVSTAIKRSPPLFDIYRLQPEIMAHVISVMSNFPPEVIERAISVMANLPPEVLERVLPIMGVTVPSGKL